MKSFLARKTNNFHNVFEYFFLCLAIVVLFLNLNMLNYNNIGNASFSSNMNTNHHFESRSFNQLSFWSIPQQATTPSILYKRIPLASRGINERKPLVLENNNNLNQEQAHLPSRTFNPVQPHEDLEEKESKYFKDSTITSLNNSNFTEKDLYWLARIVQAEAPGDIDDGQIAVANVVLNRLNSGWARTIKDVIFQRINGTYQFTPVENGTIYNTPPKRAVNNAIRALNGERMVPKNVYYFYMPASYNQNDWIRTRPIYRQIGIHRFCF